MNPNEELFREGVSFIKYLFDIEDLYEEQEVVINEFFHSKRNIFLSAGTGFGKSLVYQALPIINDYVTGYAVGSSCILVVSPLIALMDDQVRQCEASGIAAVALYSNDEITNKLRDVILWYTCPPKLPSVKVHCENYWNQDLSGSNV